LRRAWKRFWLLVSLAVAAALPAQAGLRTGGLKRINELALARLGPGRDHRDRAQCICRKLAIDAERDSRATNTEVVQRDACGRIEEISGKAESPSPSAKGGDKLELYLHAFDWARPAVPQVMEVSCDVTTQTVTEIALAASSL
jgi:hypothetical protein